MTIYDQSALERLALLGLPDVLHLIYGEQPRTNVGDPTKTLDVAI